jgi:hypothetical protein
VSGDWNCPVIGPPTVIGFRENYKFACDAIAVAADLRQLEVITHSLEGIAESHTIISKSYPHKYGLYC